MFFFNHIKKKKLIFFFLLICFIYNVVQIYQFAIDKYAYQYGDWLINYSNGFVRRGLGGEIVYYFSYLFGKNIQVSYFILLICLLVIFYYISFDFFSKINFNFFIIFLFFSPFLFLFFTLNHKAGVRKEILLYIYFIFLLNSLSSKYIKKIEWKYIIFFPIILLIHEGLFFFLPFIIIVFLLVLDRKNYKIIFLQLILFVLLSFCILLMTFFFKGDANSVKVICDSLSQYAYQNCKNWGAISWLSSNVDVYVNQTFNFHDYEGYLYWLINFIYGFFPFLLIFLSKNFEFSKNIFLLNLLKIKIINLIIIFFTLLIIFVLPLFILAIDWGRWLSIIYHLSCFTTIFFIKKKIIILKLNNFFLKIVKFYEINKKLFLILILIYSHFLVPGVFYTKDINKFMSLNFSYVSLYNNFKKTFSKY